MFLTKAHLSRRAVLKGLGATIALPWLDAMSPAFARASATKAPTRLVCMEMVHGAAGSSKYGVERNLWSPAAIGRDFDLSPTSLRSLTPFQDYLTIISNTDIPSADPTEAREIGGDHYRSSATYLTQTYVKRTDGADVEAGTSFDQVYAQRFGQDTPIPSMQLCIENIDQAGGCGFGYSCVYTDSISWASPTKPLPMLRSPRVAFDQMFNVFGTGATDADRRERRSEDRSILDYVARASERLRGSLGAADRTRLSDYLDNVREMERRIQTVEARNGSGEPRELPGAPNGVPDSFADHVAMMFDLQLLAFKSDVTRVFSLKLGRDGSNRAFPESGANGAFHVMSHHGDKPERIQDFARVNAYHVSMLPRLLAMLKNTPDGDGTLLDHTMVMYGSPMGDPNLHNHKKVPFLLAGRAGGVLKGGVHVMAPNQTPLSDVMLGLLQSLGFSDMKSFGDSDAALTLS